MEITTVEIITRIAVALLLGSVMGLERSLAGKGAGFRTYGMVAVGSSVFMLISQMIPVVGNPIYLGQTIISGIGFIGAGLVFFQAESHRITGLTTAAGLWVVAGVGMSAGCGLYNLAIIATVAALAIFTIFSFVEKGILKYSYKRDGKE